MKITEIRIKNYLQFKDFYLNLTYPDTGEPLDKICFIGSNGTGKTTLLNFILELILGIPMLSLYKGPMSINNYFDDSNNNSIIYVCIKKDLRCIHILLTPFGNFCFPEIILKDRMWKKLSTNNFDLYSLNRSEWQNLGSKSNYNLLDKLQLADNAKDLISYAKSDINLIEDNDLPEANVDQALELFNEFSHYHDVSFYNVNEFWKVLIYQIKKRENQYLELLNSPDIENLSVKQVKEKFNQEHPEILQKLAEQWNLILEKPGLEFDVENAKIPIQLNDNLEAYIKLRNTNEIVPYNKLSTGIRNFIFQLGYIYTLYFNRDIQRGFLLIDEPEASLFPDLLYDIIDRYLSIIQNTQFFVATHSPIIAAQFDPAERFILEFNDDGYVEARSGVSPEGDDPNDLLVNDFVVRSLYGKKGVEKWQRYLELQRLIPETEDLEKKKELLKEYSSIGNAATNLRRDSRQSKGLGLR